MKGFEFFDGGVDVVKRFIRVDGGFKRADLGFVGVGRFEGDLFESCDDLIPSREGGKNADAFESQASRWGCIGNLRQISGGDIGVLHSFGEDGDEVFEQGVLRGGIFRLVRPCFEESCVRFVVLRAFVGKQESPMSQG